MQFVSGAKDSVKISLKNEYGGLWIIKWIVSSEQRKICKTLFSYPYNEQEQIIVADLF